MSIKPISSLINDNQRVIDILNELGNAEVAVVTITENGVGHAYFGLEELRCIDFDLLYKYVLSSLIVKKPHGYEVNLEV